MKDRIRFHLDENISQAIANGLRRRGIDVTTTPEESLIGKSDEEQLAFAVSQKRVIFTQDTDFLRLHQQGVSHYGIVYCQNLLWDSEVDELPHCRFISDRCFAVSYLCLLTSIHKLSMVTMIQSHTLRILQKYLSSFFLSVLLLFSWGSLPVWAGLAPGNAITDGRTLLRYALPIQNTDIRDVQSEIEAIAENLRGKRWSPIRKNVDKAYRTLQLRLGRIVADTPASNQSQVSDRLEALKQQIQALEAAVKSEDKEKTWEERRKTLIDIGTIEDLMVAGFPYSIPPEYDRLPRLLGRATVKFTTDLGDLTAVLDGYSAPLTAGNFAELVHRGFYDGLPITRAEEFYVLQLGDPPGPATGFIDPATGKERTIPLELLVNGDKEPIYGFTLEELGLYQEKPVLPFAAFGTLGMARPSNDVNGASSQFFFYLFEPELAPAGFNLLDGRYAAFGYVVEGSEILDKLQKGDRILKAEVISGLENLVGGR